MRLGMARVRGITQFYLPPTRLSTNGMNCRSSVGQGKFAGQRLTFYHSATQPTIWKRLAYFYHAPLHTAKLFIHEWNEPSHPAFTP